ncbi:sepiapterin reductase-like [Styela clava]
MFSMSIFSEPTFAVITGGSQGLGRSITEAFATRITSKSVIVITGRNLDGLKDTARRALQKRKQNGKENDIEIQCISADLSDFMDVRRLGKECLDGRRSIDFPTALLIHNAASLGDLSKEVCDFEDPEEVSKYFTVNLAHLPCITGNFLKWRNVEENNLKTIIINVSSLFAIQPHPCFSLYASGKAARDMLFKVLAKENPAIRVLNWAPGPLDTEMSETIMKTSNKHNTAELFIKLKDEGKTLTCEQSNIKLMEVLAKDEYESGQHVDYFD